MLGEGEDSRDVFDNWVREESSMIELIKPERHNKPMSSSAEVGCWGRGGLSSGEISQHVRCAYWISAFFFFSILYANEVTPHQLSSVLGPITRSPIYLHVTFRLL